jgi:hypothetical protein
VTLVVVTAFFFLGSALAFGQDKVKGIITGRAGDTVIVKSMDGPPPPWF